MTHDQEEAMRLSQRIAIFSHGKIVGLGTGYDLYQNPPNAFVASFLGNPTSCASRPAATVRAVSKANRWRFA